jgi:hypothetical protein
VSEKARRERLLPNKFDMANETREVHERQVSVAEKLVGDGIVAAACVARLRHVHDESLRRQRQRHNSQDPPARAVGVGSGLLGLPG